LVDGAWGRTYCPSLPMSIRRVESAALDDYLDNLLPEGPVRAALEQQYGLRPGDGFELLSHIGGDCAGAVQIAVDESPPPGRLVPLADDEVNAIVSDLPTLSPPPGEAVSAALGGVQSKVLLTRTQSGWAWPAAGAVSTHIIKPEPVEPQTPIPRIIEYEHWTLQLAAMAAARSELLRFGERRALVVERYDRRDGECVHQEDFAQALGIRPAPDDKALPTTRPSRRTRPSLTTCALPPVGGHR
jgi:serine/threonine-protein kinase HipA